MSFFGQDFFVGILVHLENVQKMKPFNWNQNVFVQTGGTKTYRVLRGGVQGEGVTGEP